MKKYPLLHKIGKIPEIIVLFVYAAAHLCMAFVHEPFFDEAEAWQIARCASLRTLFVETTHYEGHPPLWHLILMPLAKVGAPYELSLTLVSLLFMGTAVFLILRYAPFPRPVRLLLPFTYFFFYQYGVISRVYCVMTLAFVLLAIVYPRRNERPGRYVAVLMLMSVTLAYGLVIAGGLALVWLWEIANESWRRQGDRADGQKVGELLRGCVTDKRIRWLAALLAVAVFVIWMIMPRTDTFAVASAGPEHQTSPLAVRLLYTFLVLPADAVLTDVYSDSIILSQASLPAYALASGAVVGLLIWALLLYYGKKRGTVLLLVLPYSLFAAFSAVVYMSLHHIGIGLLYFCFWCWVSIETDLPEDREKDAIEISHRDDAESAARKMSDGMERKLRGAAIFLGTLAMAVSLFWTAAACVLDIRKNYAPGRGEAAFIKAHQLDSYRIMSAWVVERDEEGNITEADINMCDQAVNLAPYFAHNLYFNFNGGRDDRNYITHIRLSEEETLRQYEQWSREEPPQVLWMSPDLSAVYGEKVKWQDYVQVYRAPAQQVWKTGTDYRESSIYVRRELLKETGLQPLQIGN